MSFDVIRRRAVHDPGVLFLWLRCPFHGRVLARNSVEMRFLPYTNISHVKENNDT